MRNTIIKSKSDVEVRSAYGKSHVVVLAGGMSSEREVSLSSSETVVEALITSGYKVTFVDIGSDIAIILAAIMQPGDVVYNCLHGTYGEDGCIQGLLNIMRIPYTHAGVLGSSLAFNKLKSREIFLSNNIECIPGIIVHQDDKILTDPYQRPYVIKPISQGSSVGVEVIFDEDQFDFGQYEYNYGKQIMVEKYIKSRELQVAVLNGKSIGVVLEVEILKGRFYDYEVKYTAGLSRHIIPARVNDDVAERALRISEKVCALFGASKGPVRVEFLYSDTDDKLYILELNTHPGMTSMSIYPEIAMAAGIEIPELIESILSSASYDQ